MIQFIPNMWLMIYLTNMMFFMLMFINMYYNKKF